MIVRFCLTRLFLLSVVLLTPSTADADDAITTGTALEILGEPVPSAPEGFGSEQAALVAIAAGKLKMINMLRIPSANITVRENVEYGRAGQRSLKLDLYSPKKTDRPVPGLVFIHGGGWKKGQKEDYRYYGMEFAEKGYVVASIQYRLSGEAPYPAAVHDAKAAVRWMRAEAEQLGVDPDRIGVAGGSAGGHLSMMVGYSSDVESLEGDSGHPGVSSRVQAVVNIYGPTDLTTAFARKQSTPGSLLARFFGGTLAQKRADYEQGSPIRHVTADDPPTLILHGTVDAVVPVDQADLLAARLKEVGVPYIYDRLPGWPHAMDIAQPVNERCVWLMERFFEHYLKPADK